MGAELWICDDSYLAAVSTACGSAGPQLVFILLEGLDLPHIDEAEIHAPVALLSIPQYCVTHNLT